MFILIQLSEMHDVERVKNEILGHDNWKELV